MVLRAREGVLEHARNHDAQDQISEAHYVTVGGNASNARASPSAGDGKCHCDQDCPYQDKEKHYHCTWVSTACVFSSSVVLDDDSLVNGDLTGPSAPQDNCREIILPSDKPFRRLDHYKMHEYSRKLSQSRDPLTTMHLASSIDAMFRRKRGRPPKNRVIEVWNDYVSVDTPIPACCPAQRPSLRPTSSRSFHSSPAFDEAPPVPPTQCSVHISYLSL